MRSTKLLAFTRSAFMFFGVAGTKDPRAFKPKIEALQFLSNQEKEQEKSQRIHIRGVQKNNLYVSLETFVKETFYLPRLLSVVVRELQIAGVIITEADVIFALETVGNHMKTKEGFFEKSPSEVDKIWNTLPASLRNGSSNLQYYFLQYTENIYEALKIIEKWFAKADRAKARGDDAYKLFPVLKNDFVSRVIAEAARKIKNPFDFSLFLLEKFALSQSREVIRNDLILFQLPLPSNAISALFLTVANGNELKGAASILDAQLELTKKLDIKSSREGVYLNENIIEALLFGCTRAIDYEHRLDVAQAYFRRYKDECLLEEQGSLRVTSLMYESLMYIAADIGEIDIHQNLRVEANEKQTPCPLGTKLLGGHVQHLALIEQSSQYATHVIALARAGYLADILPALKVILDNRISLPVHSFQVILEEIGWLAKKKRDIFSASLRPKKHMGGYRREISECYSLLPPQYHNGFQMINDIVKLMYKFGLDLYRPSSFSEYEESRGKTRIPKGSHSSFIRYMIEAYTRLGSTSVSLLQTFFIDSPAQYSINAFCDFASRCESMPLSENRELLRSVVLLFLLRCFSHRFTPKANEEQFSHVPSGSSAFRLPLHEQRFIQQINMIIFDKALGTITQKDHILNSRAESSDIRNHREVKKHVSKGFTYPTYDILEKLCIIEKPVVLFPGMLENIVKPDDSVNEYLGSLNRAHCTVVIPFSFLADGYFTYPSNKETDDSPARLASLAEIIRKFDTNLKGNIWYVTLEEELIIRSYSRRRKASIDNCWLNCHKACELCCLYFIEGLIELLKSYSGGIPMPLSIYTGSTNSAMVSFLERKLYNYLEIIDIL